VINNLLLIGDSITEGFNTKELLPNINIVNKGVSGDSTFETINRIEESWFDSEPELIFICIGTNDLPRDTSDETILSNIKKIALRIKDHYPDGKIFLMPLFPTLDNPPRPNSRIVSLNIKIKYLTDELSCGFFNTYPHFADNQGNLKSEFTNDGLHLTDRAYKHWSELIIKFIELL
jgi:lysophospholipase L1-like esterase